MKTTKNGPIPLDNYNKSNCPQCNFPDKEIITEDHAHYFVQCKNCGYKTPEFKFVSSAQWYWILEGDRNDLIV